MGTGAVPPVKDRVDEIVHSPVFVDASGRRRAWIARTVTAFSALCCGYVAVLAVGLLGGPVRPGDLLPWVAPAPARTADPAPEVTQPATGGSGSSSGTGPAVQAPVEGTVPVPGPTSTVAGVIAEVAGRAGTASGAASTAGPAAVPGSGSASQPLPGATTTARGGTTGPAPTSAPSTATSTSAPTSSSSTPPATTPPATSEPVPTTAPTPTAPDPTTPASSSQPSVSVQVTPPASVSQGVTLGATEPSP